MHNTSASASPSSIPSSLSLSSSSSSAEITQEILSCSVDVRNNITEEDRDMIFRLLRSRLDNRICFDCSSRNPTWLSLTYAIFLCLNCSGKHRRFGTHVSFVRSAEMDKFTRDQLIRMHIGGNGRARSYFREHGVVDGKHVEYFSKLAQKYKLLLDKEINAITNTSSNSLPEESQIENEKDKSFSTIQSNLLDMTNEDVESSKINSSSVYPVVSSFGYDEHTVNNTSKNNLTLNASNTMNVQNSKNNINSNTMGLNANNAYLSSLATSKSINVMKVKKLDFDFDFDRVDENNQFTYESLSSSPLSSSSLADHLTTANNTNLSVSSLPFSSFSSISQNVSSSVFSSNRFASAKAISSKQYFNDINRNENSSSLPSFFANTNKTSMSSDELFGKQNKSSFEENAAMKLESFKASAQQGISAIAAASSEVVARARYWLNS